MGSLAKSSSKQKPIRVLMFGWEFPPFISGGLGTACFGLTQALLAHEDVHLTLVVPKKSDNHVDSSLDLIGANEVQISKTIKNFKDSNSFIEYLKVDAEITPYQSPQEYKKLKSLAHSNQKRLVQVNSEGKINFSGKYTRDLFNEMHNYALVCEKIIEGRQFDVIHAHDWLTFPAAMKAQQKSGAKLIVQIHSTEFDRIPAGINPSVFAIEQEGIKNADKVITVSNFSYKTIVKNYCVDPQKIAIIYNGIQPFNAPKTSQSKSGKRIKQVAFIGRITAQKGPSHFMEAAQKVLETNPDVHFVMAGTGDLLNEMIQKGVDLNIINKFQFTGFLNQTEVISLLKKSDVFVMPSISEPFGIVALEAIQCEVPAILSKNSGVSEIVHNAIKVDPTDVEAIAKAMHLLLNNEALGHLLSKQAKIEIKELTWNQAASRTVSIYKEPITKRTST